MYLPPIHLWEAAAQKGSWSIDAAEHYHKRSFRNSCLILTSAGLQLLTIPVCKGKTNALIRDVAISYDEPWPVKHLRAIQTAYGNSPCFIHFFPELESILMKRHSWLWDLNMELITWIQSTGIVESFEVLIQDKQEDRQYHIPLIDRSNYQQFMVTPYIQLFSPTTFIHNLSILDKLFQDCV